MQPSMGQWPQYQLTLRSYRGKFYVGYYDVGTVGDVMPTFQRTYLTWSMMILDMQAWLGRGTAPMRGEPTITPIVV